MSIGQIVEASAKAAAKAARLHKRPFVIEKEDIAEAKRALEQGRTPAVLRRFPFIGDYIAPGWELVETIFADATGLDESGPALSVRRLVGRLKVGCGYAIVEAGEFQVYVGEFRRILYLVQRGGSMRRQKARILLPGGEERTQYSQGKKFTLEELQGMVGGHIEHVILPRGNGHATAYINEDGYALFLGFNANASAIYKRGVIVGPMAIVSTEKGEA